MGYPRGARWLYSLELRRVVGMGVLNNSGHCGTNSPGRGCRGEETFGKTAFGRQSPIDVAS